MSSMITRTFVRQMSSLPCWQLNRHPLQVLMVDRVLSEVQTLVVLKLIVLFNLSRWLSSAPQILHKKENITMMTFKRDSSARCFRP
jgi:hypothetical protein